jgi:hypothetical protein
MGKGLIKIIGRKWVMRVEAKPGEAAEVSAALFITPTLISVPT